MYGKLSVMAFLVERCILLSGGAGIALFHGTIYNNEILSNKVRIYRKVRGLLQRKGFVTAL
jgi:hypothetical protein